MLVAVLVAINYKVGSKYSIMAVGTGLVVSGDGDFCRQGCISIRIGVGRMNDVSCPCKSE